MEEQGTKISVIIPVYNVGEYLEPCLDSVLEQDMPASDYEIVAVDDGSTDGSGELLDKYAADHRNVRVIHQENSGWPGSPRNVGTDASVGEYVFYMDADDFLGPEALRRMYDFATAHSSDVVLVKLVRIKNVDGRWERRVSGWAETQVDADPRRMFRTLSPMKLIRRSLLEAHGLRFPEGKVRLEDGIFVTKAYIVASRVSILADYDYYFVRGRDTGGHISLQSIPPEGYARSLATIIETMRELPDEQIADDVVFDLYRRKALKFFVPDRFLRYGRDKQAQLVHAMRHLAETHVPLALDERLSVPARLRSHVIRSGDVGAMVALAQAQKDDALHATVRDGRVLVALPHLFASDALDVTRSIRLDGRLERISTGRSSFTVHAQARFRDFRSDRVDAELLLRERGSRREVVLPVRRAGEAADGWHRLTSRAPGKALTKHGAGVWDLSLRCRLQGKVVEARLAVPDETGEALETDAVLVGERLRATPYATDRGNLSIRVKLTDGGERRAPQVARTRAAGQHALPVARRWLTGVLRRLDGQRQRRPALGVARMLGLDVARVQPGALLIARPGKVRTRSVGTGATIVQRPGSIDVVRCSKATMIVTNRRAALKERPAQEKGLQRYLAAEHVAGILAQHRVTYVIDVGPDGGRFARQIRRAGYRGRISSFEPVPHLARELEVAAADDEHWTVHRIALGRADAASEQQAVRRLDSVLDELTADLPRPHRLFVKLATQGSDLEDFEGLGRRIDDVVALQSRLALPPHDEAGTRLDHALKVYADAGYTVSGLFPRTRDKATASVLDCDCVLVRVDAL